MLITSLPPNLLKSKIQLSKFENLIGSIQQSMNQAASLPSSTQEGASRNSATLGGFYKQKEGGTRKLLAKEKTEFFQARSSWRKGRAGVLLHWPLY